MDGSFPQLPPLYRDSEGLRTNMIAQRNKFTSAQASGTLTQTPQNFHQNLKQWAQLPVKAALLPQRASNPEHDIPAEPTLSYMQSAPEEANGIVSGNLARHEANCTDIVCKFLQYANDLLAAAYEDISDFRQRFQYEMSGIEVGFSEIVQNQEKSPQQLIAAIEEVGRHARRFLNETCDAIQRNTAALLASVQTEARRIVELLMDECCTIQSANAYLERPLSDFQERYGMLQRLTDDFTRSSESRIQMTLADYGAQAARVMNNRRKRAAELLIRDFRTFVVEQNEWSQPLVESVNDCNCQNQQMSGSFHDRLAQVQGANREQLYGFLDVFLRNKAQNAAALRMLHETFNNVKRTIIEGRDQTIERLQQIAMPGSSYCEEVVAGWERRWDKRVTHLCEANSQQIQANSFYICGIIAVFGLLEQISVQACDAERKMRDYFTSSVSAVENRFQRDIERYGRAISDLQREYANVWSPEDAQRMSTIATRLIDAMEQAVQKRQETLVQLTAGEDSVFSNVVRDTLLAELRCYASIFAAGEPKLVGYDSQGLVEWNEGVIRVARLDALIEDRNKDIVKGTISDLPVSQQSDSQQRASSAKQASKTSPSRSAQAKRDTGKQAKGKQVYQLGENGLYAELPKFSDIDQAEYLKQYGFTFNTDGFDEHTIREQIMAAVGQVADKKKEIKRSKTDAQPAALQGIDLQATQVVLSTNDNALQAQMNTVTDLRVILHIALLHYLHEEGKRIAFNKAREAFIAHIQQWRLQYIQILNEIAQQSVAEQLDKYQKEKAAVEKRNKTKKGQPEELTIKAPELPEPISQLPADVEARLADVHIPEELQRPKSDVHITLMYCLLQYEQLKQIPDSTLKYAIEVSDIMFEDTDGIDPTPNVSGPPTRPGTGKSQKKAEKATKQLQQKPQIHLPQPEGLKQFFGDSRLVTHGQSAILEMVFNQMLKTEVQALLERTRAALQFYARQGELVRQRCSTDSYRLALQHQSHRMRYVQQNLESIRLQFAQRNGISMRLVERGQKLVSELETRLLFVDTRFQGFQEHSASVFGTTTTLSAVQSAHASPDRAKSAKKKAETLPSSSKAAADQELERSGASTYFELRFDEASSRVSAVICKDQLGQNIPLLRCCEDAFKEVFLARIAEAVAEHPEILDKVIMQQSQALISALVGRITNRIIPGVDARLQAFLSELQQKMADIKCWGNQSGQMINFGFADATVAFLRNNYNTPDALVEVSGEQITAHPTYRVCEALILQIELLREDIRSKLAQDLYLIQHNIKALSFAVRACNAAHIQKRDKLTLVRRETSALSAAITGRLSSVRQGLEGVFASVKHLEQAFCKASGQTGRSFADLYELALEYVDSALFVEHQRYLLGYDRNISDIVYAAPVVYCPSMELYQQRQKALNYSLALLIVQFNAFNQQYAGDVVPKREFDLFQKAQQYIQTKNFVLKNKIYADNSAVDVLTQFQYEYKEMMTKFPGAQIVRASDNSAQNLGSGESFFVNQCVGKMAAELQEQLDSARAICAGLCDALCSVHAAMMKASQDSFVELALAILGEQRELYTTRVNELQDQFLQQFDQLYQQVRPALAKYPEKQKEIAERARQFYAQHTQQLDSFIANEKYTLQRDYMLFSALVCTVLHSFAPFERGSLQCCLQLVTYIEQFGAPARDTRSKTPAEEPVRNFLDQKYIPEEPKNAQTYPAIYLRVLKLMCQSFAAKRTLFSYEAIDQKALAALKQATPMQSLLFDKPPRVLHEDATTERQFVAQPAKSEKGERKGQPVASERMQLPTMIATGLIAVVLCDPDPEMAFETTVQCLVSADKDTVAFASKSAAQCLHLCSENRKCYEELVSNIQSCQKLDKRVFDEFISSVSAVSQDE